MGEGSGAPRIIRFADAKRMPWRNGGGETVEVAVHPPGAALDAFGWRVSLARITGDGPFSTFHDVDRSFAMLDGEGLVLTVGAGPPTRLDVNSEPLRFAGEAPCRCSLSSGPATALNVMTGRGSFDGAVGRLDPARGLPRAVEAVTLLICVADGIDTDLGPLGRFDVLVVPPGAIVGVGSRGAFARAVAVSIWPVNRRRPARDR